MTPPVADVDLIVWPVGQVSSPLTSTADAPRQGDESAPTARIMVDAGYRTALGGIGVGDRLVVLTWLHLADRHTLAVRPRGDASRDLTGVFATRSPHRPNPVGLHDVTVTDIDGASIIVDGLEAIDGTPVLDIKPALGPIEER